MYGKNIYKGLRYVPVIEEVWDSTKEYEGLTIVLWQGNSYTSKRKVPVGADINNKSYWACTGNYNAQVEAYRQEVVHFSERITQLGINVKTFGAKGDGKTDDTAAIKRAIQCMLDHKTSSLYFPTGTYCISEPLDLYKNGRYVNVTGAGFRDTFIKAIKEMPYMVKLWDNNIYTQHYIAHMGFQMEDKAQIGIEGYKSVYTTLDNISVWTAKKNSVMVRIGSWCNRVVDSMFMSNYGYTGNPKGILPCVGIQINPQQSTNNLVIQRNVIERVETCIFTDDFVNDLIISENTFDQCARILYAKSGLRHCVFENNYCEGCGGGNSRKYTDNPVVYKVGNYTRTIYSPFVLHENPVMGSKYLININIRDNQFANCWKEELVTISGAKNFIFENNNFYGTDSEAGQYSYSKVIRVIGLGCSNSISGVMRVNNTYHEIKDFVIYDNNYGAFFRNDGNIYIEDYQRGISNVTSKSRIPVKIAGQPIPAEGDLTINSARVMRIDFDLSLYDSKNPFKIIVNGQAGLNVTYNLFNKASSSIMTTETRQLTGGTAVFNNAGSEAAGKQYTGFYFSLKGDVDTRIDSVYLQTCNGKRPLIQLL